MKFFAALILSASALLAAGATGTWSGSFTPAGQEPGPAWLVLKQDGSKLTGTAGPSADMQHELSNGKVEGATVTFEVAGEETTMKFVLKLDGDSLKGEASRERDGQRQTAQLDVTRRK